MSWSIEENVGLKVVAGVAELVAVEIGGLASLFANELEAVVDIKGPVAPKDAPGFSLSYLFKYAMYSPFDLRLSWASASLALRVLFTVLSSFNSTFWSSSSF